MASHGRQRGKAQTACSTMQPVGAHNSKHKVLPQQLLSQTLTMGKQTGATIVYDRRFLNDHMLQLKMRLAQRRADQADQHSQHMCHGVQHMVNWLQP
jgi:hypothetical protein